MKDELISLFIDDELNLDEKTVFVETVHADALFTKETLDLLEQEKLLTTSISVNRPMPRVFPWKRLFSFRIPFKAFAAVLAIAVIIMFIVWPGAKDRKAPKRAAKSEPAVEQAEISSSFSQGRPLPAIFSDQIRYWKYPIEFSPDGSDYSYFLDWKLSVANSNVQFRKELKYHSSEMAALSFN